MKSHSAEFIDILRLMGYSARYRVLSMNAYIEWNDDGRLGFSYFIPTDFLDYSLLYLTPTRHTAHRKSMKLTHASPNISKGMHENDKILENIKIFDDSNNEFVNLKFNMRNSNHIMRLDDGDMSDDDDDCIFFRDVVTVMSNMHRKQYERSVY